MVMVMLRLRRSGASRLAAAAWKRQAQGEAVVFLSPLAARAAGPRLSLCLLPPSHCRRSVDSTDVRPLRILAKAEEADTEGRKARCIYPAHRFLIRGQLASRITMARASSSSLEPPSKRKRSSGSHESSRERKERRGSTSSRGSESEADSIASSSSTASSSKKKKSKSSSSKDRHAAVNTRAPYMSQVPLSSAFELQYPILTLSIPPVHASQPMVALVELFDSLVMRFVPPLNGILISHGTAYFIVDEAEAEKNAQGAQVDHQWTGVGPSSLIGADAAFATSRVAVECCVWRPKVGMKVGE